MLRPTLFAAALAAAFAPAAHAATLTTLATFADGQPAPLSGAIADANGILYGTTVNGGASQAGSIWAVQGGTLTTLYSFTGAADGANPAGSLLLGSNGVLYGTTAGGGNGYGTVFSLTPPAIAGGTWTLATLYSFSGTDGAYPMTGLTLAPNGTIYGVTAMGGPAFVAGGAAGNGTVFALSTAKTRGRGNGGGHGYGHGGWPGWGLGWGHGGWTWGGGWGGWHGGHGNNGGGNSGGGSVNGLQTLYAFAGGSDGAMPTGTLATDSSGNLYGTTQAGGTAGAGTVFRIVPSSKAETVLYSFLGNPAGDGGTPYAGVAVSSTGTLYGTTQHGGAYGSGAVYQLVPGSSGYTETLLYSFTGGADGNLPLGPVLLESNGTLAGTTVTGGDFDFGCVYTLTPGSGSWTESVVASFDSAASTGVNPQAGLLQTSAGLVTTTSAGAASGFGALVVVGP